MILIPEDKFEAYWALYAQGAITESHHTLWCIDNPAFSSFSAGAHYLTKNPPPKFPLFYYSSPWILARSGKHTSKRFDRTEQIIFLEEMDDVLKAASRAGDVKTYETACRAISSLVIARKDALG